MDSKSAVTPRNAGFRPSRELADQRLHLRDRDGEAHVLRARRIGDRGVDGDDPTLRVDERASGVARVDRGVGLDHVAEEAAGLVWRSRCSPETIPRVTLRPPSSASALPIATTSSPTCTLSESPSSIVEGSCPRPGARPGRSAGAAEHLGGELLPVGEVRLDLSAPSTTWLFVTMTPSDDTTNPVPAAPPLPGPPSSTMATTAGTSAFRIAAMSPSLDPVGGRTITSRPAAPSLPRCRRRARRTPPPPRAHRPGRRRGPRAGTATAPGRRGWLQGRGSGGPGRRHRSAALVVAVGHGSSGDLGGAGPAGGRPCARGVRRARAPAARRRDGETVRVGQGPPRLRARTASKSEAESVRLRRGNQNPSHGR